MGYNNNRDIVGRDNINSPSLINMDYRKLGNNQNNKSLEQRFWEKVDKQKKNECWEWLAHKHSNGYGQFERGKLAHRFSWELHFGEIPKDKNDRHGTFYVLHRCDNRICVNPNHLFLGTTKDNTRDMVKKGRVSRTHQGRGEKQGNSKLTEEVVKIIRELYKRPDLTQAILAREFNTHQTTICGIVKRKSWKHI